MPEGVKITTVDTDNAAVYVEMTAAGWANNTDTTALFSPER